MQSTRFVARRAIALPFSKLSIAVASLIAAHALGGVNLLINPSFEAGPTIPGQGYLPLNAGATDITGWTVTRGQIDLVGPHWQSGHASRSLDLNGSPGTGGVSQTFPTIPGHSYTVTFRLAGNPGNAPTIKLLRVTAAGAQADLEFNITGASYGNMRWARKIWNFQAVSDTTTIEFYSLLPSGVAGPALDDVSVRDAACPADLSGDGFVDDADFVLFAQQYDEFECDSRIMPDACSADLNFSNFVDDADFVLFTQAYGEFACE